MIGPQDDFISHFLLTKQIATACSFALAVASTVGAASAGPLAAIVENADPRTPSIAAMDYLERGRTIDLGATGWVEIGYFASCTHERITGGLVRVGVEQSEVTGGAVDRRQVECDRDNLIISEPQSAMAAGSAQRRAALKRSISVGTAAELTLHSTSPLIVAYGAGEVEVWRPTDKSDRQTLKIDGAAGRNFYDFAQNGRALQSGAVYRAMFNDRTIAFRIAPDAAAGATEMLGRLILFTPEPR